MLALKLLPLNWKTFIATILLFTLVSCQSGEAVDFSNMIVKKYKSLLPDIRLTETLVMQYVKENNYDSIVIVSEKMEKLTDQKISEIQNIEVPHVNNAAVFKQSVIDYFAYIKSIYSGYKDLGLAKEGKDREIAGRMVMLILHNKDTVVAQMQRIQMKFAESNGFKIKEGI